MEHRLLPDAYKSLIERAIQYVKERIGVEWSEGFDDHYPCRREGCSFTHVQRWLEAFILHRQPEYLKLIELLKEAMA
ncbi:MAG: hypothetical protein QW587_10480 [Candidatus Bathyarchaeia archaeon]